MKRLSSIMIWRGGEWFTKNIFKNISFFLAASIIICSCLGSCSSESDCCENKLLADSLQNLLEHYNVFVDKKNERIDRLKNLRSASGKNKSEQFIINQQLIDEYRKFQADSAIAYARRNLELSRSLGDMDKLVTSLNQLSMSLSMTGRFREAEALLDGIDPATLTAGQRCEYYEALNFFWEYYSISINHDQVPPIAYKDSLLAYHKNDSNAYRIEYAVSFSSSDSVRTEQEFQKLFDSIPVGSPEYAMLTNYFASINKGWGNRERAKRLYRLSAITDLRNATRETISMQALALMEQEEGNLQDAYRFTSRTVDDIMQSGISFRAPEIYNFYSILSNALREQERKNHRSLIIFICFLTVGLIVLALMAFMTYRQMKRIQAIKGVLAESNEALKQLNEQLNETNAKLNEQNDLLVESNMTKEHYITQFFDVCFSYISKMEKKQNLLYKLTVNHSFEQLAKHLQSDAIIKEGITSLYERFDSVFLRLYPTFVESINSLLRPEERIKLKHENTLTRELRIYALLRLGISDSAKISSFLRCSMGTIYNYRTRMRARAIDRDRFEDDVMKIPAAHDV